MYPLKFNPILKERLWGGTKLRDVLNKPIENDITGESWELSTVKGDVSVVSNGDLAGISLQELINTQTNDLLGVSVAERFGKEFPILIKFIDAKQDLSIQLHPNDELAKKRHNSFGKTEMWYVMDADQDAELIVGFNKDVAKDEYANSIKNDTLLDLLNYEKVKEGDTFFINTGKIHAIGAGVLLAEIQQTSDVTYRVFDFNRKDKNGNLRELHTEQALDAIDYTKKDDFKVAYSTEKNEVNTMVDCPYFKTNFIELTENIKQDVTSRDSFTIYMCVGGSATVKNEFGEANLVKGETILVPALSKSIEIISSGAKLLEVTI
ncbi:type I phosphomannose isomerase catalytic subunit [Cellulophaga lytica]|uniref:Phosphohexomutase n=1 Tax=Cellulophaga lytica (strain ATCC 23178 / DSM 7489 / JCM 8516 / NBRC 14961 / NCIMB 1423 / VKM B-1433 / Cy l20) TaxID=867900 RepID=F0RA17_CELLC|nr:type I phosphomannose isomerase catalytic subunit [Cellulophaga lytica]ADY28346.1 mannose-6-phosphate isomerase, class I [Cellulophaga lytica DSM 7489]AIM59410.1 mannose-6-phosphate isomerase [Cellulophaga lytica]APU09218.1 mannose-6-phosphate isomerase [Cellulophaga lytica]WQG77474.1 type I phosphomannose isomerase catalytic subunit [Cellulophaga lytica]